MARQRIDWREHVKTLLMVATGSILGSVAVSFAGNGNPETASVLGTGNGELVVPYNGFLSLNSTPVVGSRTLLFTLYDSPTGTTLSSGAQPWTEEQDVTFYNGQFSVALGKNATSRQQLKTLVEDGDNIYIGISVDDGTGNFVELSGRQKIEAAPFAAWSSNATNFVIAGADNNGTDAALEINSNGQTMLIDGNEIDSNGDLFLQNNSANKIVARSDLDTTSVDLDGGYAAFSRLSGSGAAGEMLLYANETRRGNNQIDMRIDNSGKVLANNFQSTSGTITTLDSTDLNATQADVSGIMSAGVVETPYISGATSSASQLRFYGNSTRRANGQIDMRIDQNGRAYANDFVSTDLEFTGRLSGFGRIAKINDGSGSGDHTVQIGLAENDGICFMSRMYVNIDPYGTANPGAMACNVTVENGQWVITTTQHNDMNADCYARCLTWN